MSFISPGIHISPEVAVSSSTSLSVSHVFTLPVIAIYKKNGAGKGSRHMHTPTLSKITAASHVVAQIFEQNVGSEFWATPSTSRLMVDHFDIFPPAAFLYALTQTVPRSSGTGLKICQDDLSVFKSLQERNRIVSLGTTLKEFRQRVVLAGDDVL